MQRAKKAFQKYTALGFRPTARFESSGGTGLVLTAGRYLRGAVGRSILARCGAKALGQEFVIVCARKLKIF